jgi:hypothetical protein
LVSLKKQCRCKCKTNLLLAGEELVAKHNPKLPARMVSIPKTRCKCNPGVVVAIKARHNLKILVAMVVAIKASVNLKIIEEL